MLSALFYGLSEKRLEKWKRPRHHLFPVRTVNRKSLWILYDVSNALYIPGLSLQIRMCFGCSPVDPTDRPTDLP